MENMEAAAGKTQTLHGSQSETMASHTTTQNRSIPNNRMSLEKMYEQLTIQALMQNIITEEETTPNTEDVMDINDVRSMHLLRTTMTPFTREDELPQFEHGSEALYYFQILRTLISKFIRATIYRETLAEHKKKQQIPRGLRINKMLNAVEPSTHLKLRYMQIMGAAVNSLLESLICH
jgi:hypothetical protein